MEMPFCKDPIFEYFIQKYYQNNQLNAEDRHRLINILKSEKILDTSTLMQIVVDKKYELLVNI